jgi:phosphoglycolate phosphatase
MESVGVYNPDFDRIFRVGPSLADMTEALFPGLPHDKKEEVISCFKKTYDNSDFPCTEPYPWITSWLEALCSSGHTLFILTNKRQKPTNFLVDKLGWRELFSGVICQDTFSVAGVKKTEMMKIALQKYLLPLEQVLMVGDTPEDVKTGKVNKVSTAAVLWGYGKRCELEESECDFLISSEEIGIFLQKGNGQR